MKIGKLKEPADVKNEDWKIERACRCEEWRLEN
jgi:hypothetical protein